MMASYDGHTPKRQRTDMDGRSYGEPTYYNNSGSFTAPPVKMERIRGPGDEEKPNHILLMTILNPAYPITVDVINTICTPNGKVLRIVIFKKNGVQAMVEFDSIESAKRAKDSLNGADIYSGCCTLKIEYAKPSRLNVYKNDSESWDYTNPTLGGGKGSAAPPLLGQPRGYGGDGAYSGMYMCGGPGEAPGYSGIGDDGYNGGYGERAYERFDAYRTDLDNPAARPNAPAYGMGGPAPAPQTMNQGSVMMVYGLNQEKMNCDRLFNLFCLYGNVVRIKFLKSKEGCAMVQMGDPLSVERCVTNLNHSFYFNSKMQLGFSKQAFLNDVMQPYELPDGTPSFKDYMGNRNNRFTNPEAASKNRIQAPSKVLHFFNTPPAITEEEMKKHFEEQGAPTPSTVKLFPSKSEKSSSGLLQFEDVSLALEALVLCNHMSINNPTGKYPYILKLCFSSSGVRI